MPPPLPAAALPMPPLARVEITFQYTFEELREGLTQTAEMQERKRPKFTLGLLAWTLFVALAVFLFVLLNKTSVVVVRQPSAPPAPPVDVMISVAPSALAATFVGLMTIALAVAIWIATAKDEQTRRRGGYIAAAIFIVAVFLLIVGGVALVNNPPQARWPVTRGRAMFLSLAPWIIVLILGVALTIWLMRTHLRRQYESKPYLRRRRTVVLDETGERSTDEVAEMFYRWPYFRRAWETPNCLVLQDENDARHILPKRAMDQTTLDLARSVISNHVADCKFLTVPGGFPVATALGTS